MLTTEMLLMAMARAARIGWSWRTIMGSASRGASTPAATGIRMML